jgi:D-alanyl-D-alanine carboxypeptidase/D-alanyl-D-alanine-endopeptidase (penicillin-binding protein 4)
MISGDRRDGIGPVFLLIIAAAIPAFGFGYLWRWAEARVPEPKAKEAAIAEPAPTAALTTPLLSVRRAPETLATMSSEGTLVAAMSTMTPLINDASCLVVQLDGRTVYTKGGATPVTPASNEKVITAAVALEVLGADYTFTTKALGTVVDGVVTGDLYLLGGGDPLLSTAAYPPTVTPDPPTDVTALEVIVYQMAVAGITHVAGNVIGDESRYDAERFVPTWSADIQAREAGPLGALLVNDGIQRFAPNLRKYADPAVGAATDFIALLKGAGITVGGRPQSGITPPGTPEITSVASVPLSTIVREMLTTSDDNTAEMLMKEMSYHVSGAPGTRQGGIDAIKGTLVTWNIDTTPLNVIDGSGLDSGDTVTCDLMLQVLNHAPLDGPLGAGLPVAGGVGSTLEGAFAGSLLDGRLHAKTGTLHNAKALTGFVPTTAGTITFSMLLAGQDVDVNYQPLWDQLAAVLGAYPSGPAVEVVQPR